MDDCYQDIEGIPLVMYIQPYIFEPQAVCVDQERKFPAKKASLTQITSQVIDRIKRFGKFKCCY